MPNTYFCIFPNLHLPKCKLHIDFHLPSANGTWLFQAGCANLTWSGMLPRNPLKMLDSNPLSQPRQACTAKPLRNQRLNPLKKPSASQNIAPGRIFNPGQFFGSLDALGESEADTTTTMKLLKPEASKQGLSNANLQFM